MIKISSINWIEMKQKNHSLYIYIYITTNRIEWNESFLALKLMEFHRRLASFEMKRCTVHVLVEHPSKECETTTCTHRIAIIFSLMFIPTVCLVYRWVFKTTKTTTITAPQATTIRSNWMFRSFLHSMLLVLFKSYTS